MDPHTALGLASAILQIIDFSSKIVSGANEIHSSTSGMTSDLEDSEKAITSLRTLTKRLNVNTTGAPLSADDRSLLETKRGCEDISQEIEAVIRSTKSTWMSGSKRASFMVSVKTLRRKGKLETLEEQLGRYRTKIMEYILVTISCGSLLVFFAWTRPYHGYRGSAMICRTRTNYSIH